MSSETTNWEAVARYLAGEGLPDEQAAVRQWLAEHPADAKMVAALDDALGRLTLGPEATAGVDVEAALARVKAARQADRPTRRKVLELRPRRLEWVPILAAAGVVFAAGLWMARPSTAPSGKTTIAARTLRTPVGGRDSLVLPDGSQVMLGPGSSLILTQGFGESDRRVSLQGEALFTVVHDGKRPFIVALNGVEVRDVGTAFVVHSDAGGVRVAVTEGVVDVTPSHRESTQLKAGDAASVSPTGEVIAQRGVGAVDDLAWMRGRLVFRDAPLVEVAEDLERWYGVHLDIQDQALRRRPLTATFQNDSVRNVLDVISKTLGASIERRGDTVVVRPAR